jgi:Protein of unknown function with HXXEE motif
MHRRVQLVFLCLILSQAAHSVEEYFTKLYLVFFITRYVSGLVNSDLARGFMILNIGIVAAGLTCWAVPVRFGWPTARGLMWFWAVLELCNGAVHIGLALLSRGYFPGLATTPLLLFFAAWLAVLLARA